MTRLSHHDVAGIAGRMRTLDASLLAATGATLRELAVRSPEADPGEVLFEGLAVATVPISAGRGQIAGFSEAVGGVCRHLGAAAFVTGQRDVAGIAEAAERGAEVVFVADDDRFVALDLRSGRCADNSVCTGTVYATALALAAAPLAGRDVLVVGLGPVGLGAAARLIAWGAEVIGVDTAPARAEAAARSLPLRLTSSTEEALPGCELVLDASPAPAFIDTDWVRSGSFVAAPGMPLGVSDRAREALGVRLIHEPLALGVAAMLADLVTSRRNIHAGPRPGGDPWTGATPAVSLKQVTGE